MAQTGAGNGVVLVLVLVLVPSGAEPARLPVAVHVVKILALLAGGGRSSIAGAGATRRCLHATGTPGEVTYWCIVEILNSEAEPTQDVPYPAISLIFLHDAGTNKLTFRKVPFLRFRTFFLTWTLRSISTDPTTLAAPATPPLSTTPDTGPTKPPPLA